MTAHAPTHSPVLVQEAVDALGIEDAEGRTGRRDGTYVDATFGRGGHTRLILARLGAGARVVALDRDEDAIAAGRELNDARLLLVHAHFGELEKVLAQIGVTAVDGVLADLGVSSPQLDERERGFSFRTDGPLDMRMDRSRGQTAAEWLAVADEVEIREVVERYGEERFAKQIAKAIVAARERGPVTRTRELADIVGATVRTREPHQDPATRTFQALRIYLNQELEELSLVMPQALAILAPGGRIAVISFHSLEDRIVKNFFRDRARPRVPDRLPLRQSEMPKPELLIVGKARKASDVEVRANPRSRSATLRVAERPS